MAAKTSPTGHPATRDILYHMKHTEQIEEGVGFIFQFNHTEQLTHHIQNTVMHNSNGKVSYNLHKLPPELAGVQMMVCAFPAGRPGSEKPSSGKKGKGKEKGGGKKGPPPQPASSQASAHTPVKQPSQCHSYCVQ